MPLIHRKYRQLIPHVMGAVEQTTRGIMNSEEWVKESAGNAYGFPVLSVATSKLKGTFEPRYIGRAVLRNIDSLTGTNLTGKKIAILGYGTIGKEAAAYARQIGAVVSIFDPDARHRLLANQEGFSCADSAIQAVSDAHVVIGCTGKSLAKRPV